MKWPFTRKFSGDERTRAAQHSRSSPLFSSPVLAGHYSPLRYKFMWVVFCLGFSAVIGRAAWVQVLGNDYLIEKAEERMMRDIDEPAPRGRFTDRHGNVLASSIQTASVYFSPKAYREYQEQHSRRKVNKLRDVSVDQRQIAKLLALEPIDVKKRFAESKGDYLLKRFVSWDVSEQLMALKVPGVYRAKEYQRQYPGGEAVAQLIGLTDADGVGVGGLELTFNKQLSGLPGKRRVLRDQLGRTIDTVEEERKAQAGTDVRLSVDSHVQFHAFRIIKEAVQHHKAVAGSVVVADALTGEVLALANYPSFDPSKRGSASGASVRSRAVSDMFEPGSTMKPFTAALALETGRVNPQTFINTAPGRIQLSGYTISDHKNYGMLTVEQIVQKSSNVGTVRLAQKMQAREMWEMFTSVGFGQKPQVELPGASSGRLKPFKKWGLDGQATMSYGYGLQASMLQLARAYTVFARDGEVVPLTFLQSGVPAAGVRVLSPQVALAMRHILQMAAGTGGTAPKSQPPGYSVGGKTGTARKLVDGAYSQSKYRSFFVGISPISAPRLVVAVMIDEPGTGVYYGGEVAAPVFADVVQNALRTLGVVPDLPVKPDLTVTPVEESI